MVSIQDTSTPQMYEDYGPQLNCTIWFLAALSAIFLGLRIYAKLWRRRSLWWDDYVLVASWVALVVSTSLQSVCISLGLGKHNRDISPQNFDAVLLFGYAGGFSSIVAAAWSKTSFAITLLRISDGWINRLVWSITITIHIVLGANAAIQWIQCWPLEKLWHPSVHGACWPSVIVMRYNAFAAAYSGATDVVLALIPWKTIGDATINKKEKIGVLLAMSMGVFAGITSFLKITSLSAIGNPDIATTVNLLIFGTAEGALSIIAASIPMLRALIRQDARLPTARFLHLSDDQQRTPTQLREKEDSTRRQED